jgi:hypothetical protein
MRRGASSVPKSKVEQIKSGAKTKKQVGGVKETKNVVHSKGGKYAIIETQKKFEEAGVSRKKRNYVMYEAKLGTETTTDITKINAPKPKQKAKAREIEPRQEERIVQTKKRKEYLDNYQYHETKDIKNPNPRFQVIVEHQRLGDIIGGTFEETTMQRTVFNQGSNRPQITEKTTTTTKTGSAAGPNLRGNKSQITTMKKTTVTTGETAPQTTGKRTTTTTTSTKTEQRTRGGNPTTATGKKEIITETSTRRRNEGTGSKTETRTEKKTTNTGTRGGQTESSTTTKTTTRTTGSKPAEAKETTTSTTTKTTTTRTTKTTGGDGESKTETTVTKTESKSGSTGEEAPAGGASIRKKYAKGKLQVDKQ